jgi:uncharacterized protein
MRRVTGNRARFSVAVYVAVLTAGCTSSPPMRFYTLTPVAPEVPPEASSNITPVRLARVTVPGELDRAQLVRRIDPTRLQIDDQDRWAAPLDDMIRRVLSADLAQRLSPNLVVAGNEPAANERLQALAVDIHEFYADTGCAVTLRATWVLTPPPPPTGKGESGPAARPREATEQTQVPAPVTCMGSDAVPGAMSRALALLSDRIAAAVAGAAAHP